MLSDEEVLEALRTGAVRRAVLDSRQAGPGDLFVALKGENVDGARFIDAALEQGAWGAIEGLGTLQRLATSWRRELACPVVGITGSVGKTSTKDLLAAMLRPHRRVTANERNLNTEIGLPLTVLGAPAGTEVLVLEMGMRGHGQIEELCSIAEPTHAIITAIAPVHLEQMGTIEAIAHEKAALARAIPPGGVVVAPDEPLLAPHRREDVSWLGPADLDGLDLAVDGWTAGSAPAHLRANAGLARQMARALGVDPSGRVEVGLSELRGQRIELPGAITVVNDCYNANPMSMRAALDDLAETAPGRRVAVLGDMRELGPDERRYHAEVGRHARERGVELLVGVGPLSAEYAADHHVATAAEAAELVPRLLREGDTVLVKASRGVGLEVVAEALA